MSTEESHSAWQKPSVLLSAAVFVVLYALAAAWIVATSGEDPEPLRLARTDDGDGIVVSGAVSDEDDRTARIDAVGTVTDASVIIARVVIDPDADPVLAPFDTATDLAATLGSGGG